MNEEITREEAIALAESGWWLSATPHQIAAFQLRVKKLCLPTFSLFHKALEEALGRPVWTHEIGLNWDGLVAELEGRAPAPTFAEILALIPEEKLIVLPLKAPPAPVEE